MNRFCLYFIYYFIETNIFSQISLILNISKEIKEFYGMFFITFGKEKKKY